MRRVAAATLITGIAVAALSSGGDAVDVGGSPLPYKVSLPVVGRVPLRVPAVPRPTPLVLRPGNGQELAAAVRTPDAVVLPRPGAYKAGAALRPARGVKLDGGGAVEIRGHGIVIDGAAGVKVAGLRVVGSVGDGISVLRSPDVQISDVAVGGSADGEIDITHTSGVVLVQRVTMTGHKCMLIGHPFDVSDRGLVVILRDVTFAGCQSRTPKVHFGRVSLHGGAALGWYTGIDAQRGAVVDVSDVQFRPSGKSWAWRTSVDADSVYTERRSPQLPPDDTLWRDIARRAGLGQTLP